MAAKRSRDDESATPTEAKSTSTNSHPPKKSKGDNRASGDSETPSWELSTGRAPRRVEISEFKSTRLINIREFYEKDGNFLPGKKGISLTVDQYRAFLTVLPEINARLRDLGEDIGDQAATDAHAGSPSDVDTTKAKKDKPARANIDDTSDEEDHAQ